MDNLKKPDMGDSVLISDKPIMNYVTAAVMQFTQQKAPRVIIKARGKFISRAVDVAEIVTKRFYKESKITQIATDSVDYTDPKTKRNIRVSTIEITLTKV